MIYKYGGGGFDPSKPNKNVISVSEESIAVNVLVDKSFEERLSAVEEILKANKLR